MLTGFQLRASRSVLNLLIKDLASETGLYHTTLSRLENSTPNLSYLKCNLRSSILLIKFFESKHVIFPNINSICIKNIVGHVNHGRSITRFHLKISRIAMRASQKIFGELFGIPQSTISDLETTGMISDCINVDEKLIKFFMSKGISFIDPWIIELFDDPDINLKILK
ncbi:MAG: hypothetical protein EOP33_05245 [Rickettsiaceae bacterium]|nr:MAG: hypothetical protein EOP33_05245 [Rickettsiaceae bacterium]